METIKIIQSFLGDTLDDEKLLSISRSCREMLIPLMIDLTFAENDQNKLKIIQSRQKEAMEKMKEMRDKAQYASELYEQDPDTEYKKPRNDYPLHIPVTLDSRSILTDEITSNIDYEDEDGDDYSELDLEEMARNIEYKNRDEYNELCAIDNRIKLAEEAMVWAFFSIELADLEQEYKDRISLAAQKEFPENTFPDTETLEEIKMVKRNVTEWPTKGKILPSKFLQISKEGAYELFCYLQSEYTIDDQSPVAKYSYIFHFLVYHQLFIARSQSKYMDFIKNTVGVKMSKIFPKNYKYKDDIFPLLCRLKLDFEKKK